MASSLSEAGFPPQVFLIGAQKAGTTFLANLLGAQPGVCVARPKEPDFFTRHRERGLDWYRDCFPTTEGRLLLDASTSYSAAPLAGYGSAGDDPRSRYAGVPIAIHAVAPAARFIYLVRNPAARVHSAYWHGVRTGNETLPIETALATDSTYLRTSDYLGQLRLYLEYFPREAFLILRFEDLVREPLAVLEAACDFLGLARPLALPPDSGHNRSYVYRGPLQRIDRYLGGGGGLGRLFKRLRPWLPRRLLELAGPVMTQKVPPLDAAMREDLLLRFAPMARAFADLTGVWVDPWQPPG
ncbi:MAG: sulfotransferase [Immundisolibacter sp.]|uniref:sulfotransferase n=1 Tax=Immundisolibacter sp. TaxID=1934948 RepID=UPI003EE0103F